MLFKCFYLIILYKKLCLFANNTYLVIKQYALYALFVLAYSRSRCALRLALLFKLVKHQVYMFFRIRNLQLVGSVSSKNTSFIKNLAKPPLIGSVNRLVYTNTLFRGKRINQKLSRNKQKQCGLLIDRTGLINLYILQALLLTACSRNVSSFALYYRGFVTKVVKN